jgi:hypothetical protein
MKTLEDAWLWYQETKRVLKLVHRLCMSIVDPENWTTQ